jgi:DNA primase
MELVKLSLQEAAERADSILNSENPWGNICLDLYRLGFDEDLEVASLVYITATSRLIHDSIWALVTGASGSGKSKVRSEIAECIPVGDLLKFTQMTPQALIRIPGAQSGGADLHNKFLVLDERVGTEGDTAYMRSLYEDHEVTKLIASGRKSTLLRLSGRPAMIETTTETNVRDEDQNRRIVLAVSEDPQKMRSILGHIADEASGRRESSREDIHLVHQQLQRILPRQSRVNIPFAAKLVKQESSGGFGSESTRAFKQLLSVTRTVALLNFRHRKSSDNMVIEADMDDYKVAYELLDPIFRCRAMDLPEQSGNLLRVIAMKISKLALNDPRRNGFTRKDLMEWSGVTKTTLERRVEDLVSRDHLICVQSGGRGRQHRYAFNSDWETALNGESIFVHPSDL